MKTPTITILAFLVLAGCDPELAEQAQPTKTPTYSITAGEVALLAFLNDDTLTDTELLDVECAIRSDTAQMILDYRDGPDGLPGTPDDNAIDSLDELSSIYGVGRVTIEQLAECAEGHGFEPSAPVLAMLKLVNDQGYADLELLDVDCGLHADAARNLLAHRDGPDGEPGTADDNLFHSLEEVDRVPQMGIWNVNQLMACPVRLFSAPE